MINKTNKFNNNIWTENNELDNLLLNSEEKDDEEELDNYAE